MNVHRTPHRTDDQIPVVHVYKFGKSILGDNRWLCSDDIYYG
jgi:hypothetical protein